jgi:hypothetical protein
MPAVDILRTTVRVGTIVAGNPAVAVSRGKA